MVIILHTLTFMENSVNKIQKIYGNQEFCHLYNHQVYKKPNGMAQQNSELKLMVVKTTIQTLNYN
jgi:hypothetical protein